MFPIARGMGAYAEGPTPRQHLWEGYDFGSFFPPKDRLDQGPFDIDQDQGWQPILYTTPSEKPLRNPGLGLVGYTWEESGPAVAVRQKQQSLEDHVEKMASLPFVDVLYIRCDWRNVQKQPGRLTLDPVWELTLTLQSDMDCESLFAYSRRTPRFNPSSLPCLSSYFPRFHL